MLVSESFFDTYIYIYIANSRIQSGDGNIRTRKKKSVFEYFSRGGCDTAK